MSLRNINTLVLNLRLVAVPFEVQSLIHRKLTEKLILVSKIMHWKAVLEPNIFEITHKIRSAISDASHLGLHGKSVIGGDLTGTPWEFRCYNYININ